MTHIHFAGPPCFGGAEYLALMKGRRVLFSFGEHRRRIFEDTSIFAQTILDSGAYTAHRKGNEVELDSYMAWLQRHGTRYSWYAALDLIGDGARSKENWQIMRREGLNPVPVFHGGEPFELLDEYRAHCPLVALGSTPGWGIKKRLEWYEAVFSRHEHRYHLFRATDPRLLGRFPADSVDSSTWARASAMGEIPSECGGRQKARHLSPAKRSLHWVEHFEAHANSQYEKGSLHAKRQFGNADGNADTDSDSTANGRCYASGPNGADGTKSATCCGTGPAVKGRFIPVFSQSDGRPRKAHGDGTRNGLSQSATCGTVCGL